MDFALVSPVTPAPVAIRYVRNIISEQIVKGNAIAHLKTAQHVTP